jgi:hypothetical protein
MHDEGGFGYQLVGLALIILSFIIVIALLRLIVAAVANLTPP